ncbi:MAG: two-component system, NtrC family, response regulator AtoC [Acidobacteriota bacterium]|nr:two-component system, NtrC family, response regulator AtoC [Acidobacteriota bacterium]
MNVLVIDDEAQIRTYVADVLVAEGWDVSTASSAEEAFGKLREKTWELVCCDVMLGDADGFQVLRRFKEELPDTQVVLMTGHGTAIGALDATAFGAYDYLLKPFGVNELVSLARAVGARFENEKRRRHRYVLAGQTPTGLFDAPLELVGRSQTFIEVMKKVGKVAATCLPVLLSGESGTGKEVIASAIHRRSQRASQPFVAVNCGAIPSELIESELFGHVRGAFTGAARDRKGLWEEAEGGTLFLDEITETTPAFQVKLLRALQEGEIRRVGSNKTQKVDVRVIAASNRNVETEVEAARFREDLFYRLNAVTIYLPPLRERREDIYPLAGAFAARVWSLNPTVTFTPEALRLLEVYDYPGNIRELENAVVRAVAMCSGAVRPEDLPERIRSYRPTSGDAVAEAATDGATPAPDERWLTLAEVEARYVARVLEHTGGNKQAAARLLGIDRKTIERMIKRHDLATGNAKPKTSASKTTPHSA